MTSVQGKREAGVLQGLAMVLPVITIVMGSAILAPNFPLILHAFQEQIPGRAAEYLVNALLTVPALCIALFSPLAGALADMYGRRKLLIVSMIIYGVVGTVPLIIADVWTILGSRFVLGVVEAIIMTCSTTLIGDYFSGKRRDHWLAMQTTTASASSIVMFPLGGYIGGTFGWNYPFAMYILSFVLVLLVIFCTWEPEESAVQREKAKRFPWSKMTLAYIVGLALTVVIMYSLKPFMAGLGSIELYAMSIAVLFGLSIPLMALMGALSAKSSARQSSDKKPFPWTRLAGIMLMAAISSVMFYLLQIKLAQALGEMQLGSFLSPDMDSTLKASLIIAVTSLGIPVGTLVFSRFSHTPVSILIAIEFLVIAVGFFGMGWAPSVGLMMLFCFINQFGCGLTLPTMLTWTIRQLSFEQRGRGTGIFSGYMNGGQFVGPQLLTYLAGVNTAGAIKPAFGLVGWGALAVVIGAVIAIVLRKGTQRVIYDAPEGEMAKIETMAFH